MANIHGESSEATRRHNERVMADNVEPPLTEAERLSKACCDAWAILRCVSIREGEHALRLHGRDVDTTAPVLADDMLDAAAYLRNLDS